MNKKGTALITGAAKRLGREIALNLAESGYNIVISYNDSKLEAEKLKLEIITKYNVKCEIFSCDLCDKNQVEKLAQFMTNFSDWNLLVNNASIFNKSKLLDAPDLDLFDNFTV
jgi:short-subunit dehydrogenase